MRNILKRKFRTAVCVLVILTALVVMLIGTETAFASGTVTTTKEAFGESNTVFVAGNPDMYPIEYYNKETKQFEGILPSILEKVAKDTGLSFTYLRGGEKDQRARMVSNGQAQLVTCVDLRDTELTDALKGKTDTLFTLEMKDGSHTFCMGFSETSSPEFVQSLKSSLSKISEQDLVNISVGVAENRTEAKNTLFIVLLTAGFAFLLAVIAIVLFMRLKKVRKEKEEAEVQKRNSELLSVNGFREQFLTTMNEEVRDAYTIAFVGFDSEKLSRSYGMSGISRHLSMAGNEILDFKDLDDIVAVDNNGLYILKIANDDETTKTWIAELLYRLNGETERNSSWYFRAGIYHLVREDDDCEEVMFNARQSFLEAQYSSMDYMFCTKELLKKISERRELVKDAEAGFANKEFKLFLQLTVENGTHKVVGAEALTRWNHPKFGMLHPGAFITALNEAGVIYKLDYYIFEEICSLLGDWNREKINPDCYISCNFTRNTIDSPGFVKEILSRAEKYNFDRSRLVLEITEDAFEVNREQALKNILECHDAGFRIALDDLGAGVTSFADLRDYPLDMVKIDGALLRKADSERGKTLLGAVIHMAKELNLDTLCEGVETSEQVDILESLGCHIMQGYYFFRPMPASVVLSFLEEHNNTWVVYEK